MKFILLLEHLQRSGHRTGLRHLTPGKAMLKVPELKGRSYNCNKEEQKKKIKKMLKDLFRNYDKLRRN